MYRVIRMSDYELDMARSHMGKRHILQARSPNDQGPHAPIGDQIQKWESSLLPYRPQNSSE